MRRFQTLMCLTVLILVLTPHQHLFAQDDSSWLLQEINCLRQSLGSPPLTLNAALMSAAAQHSEDLATHSLTDFHVGLDGSTPTMRANSFGFTGSVGENVAAGRTVGDVLNWWLNSSVHYNNITNENWKEIGIGIASGPRGTWYTLVFGAMTWGVEPFTAAVCGTLPQPASVLVDRSFAETATSTPVMTSSLPTPTAATFDKNGSIQHVIQSGETPGRIILMYGYSWEDLPRIMELNEMTEFEATQLNVGDIFLVPPSEDALNLTPDNDAGVVFPAASDTPMFSSPSLTPSPIPPSATSTALPSKTSLPKINPIFTPETVNSTPSSTAVLMIPPSISTQSAFMATETMVLTAVFALSPTPTPPPSITVIPDVPNSTVLILLVIVIVLQAAVLGVFAAGWFKRWRDSL